MSKTLLEVATEINKFHASWKAGYIELGNKLITARERVKKESNMPWSMWCFNYLRKANGKPFSPKTIENYIYLAGDPHRLEDQRKMQAKNIRKIRKRAKSKIDEETISTMFGRAVRTDEQVNILMTAWENASEKAQEEFLKMIGARI